MKKDKKETKLSSEQPGKKDILDQSATQEDKDTFPLSVNYPAGDDIYSKDLEEDIDPEDLAAIRNLGKKTGKKNEKDFKEDISGDDLDVPGSELDDEDENVGSEDEENNYYSLGGDNHNDLDEDKGD